MMGHPWERLHNGPTAVMVSSDTSERLVVIFVGARSASIPLGAGRGGSTNQVYGSHQNMERYVRDHTFVINFLEQLYADFGIVHRLSNTLSVGFSDA